MIIRSSLPQAGYVKMDNAVFLNKQITDGAIRLYGYLASLRNGQNYEDGFLVHALGISQTVLTRRKKELKDADLLLINRIGRGLYVAYIGHTKMPASRVKRLWEENDAVIRNEEKNDRTA